MVVSKKGGGGGEGKTGTHTKGHCILIKYSNKIIRRFMVHDTTSSSYLAVKMRNYILRALSRA